MSNIVKVMEQFIQETRYPNLIKFVENLPVVVKAYIVQFDTQAEAKANLQNKFAIAFSNVKKEARRGPGLAVNVEVLFAEAKAESSIVAEGWDTLGSAVRSAGCQIRERLETEIPNDPESDESSEEESNDHDDDYILENGFNVSATFRQYKTKCKRMAKQEGFYIDGNLHEIFSLHHVLLLKENEHPESLLKI